MIDTLTMTVILAMWTTLTWVVTYMYMSQKVERLQRYIDELEFDYGDLIDDWTQHRHDDYTEYRLNEDGSGNWYPTS